MICENTKGAAFMSHVTVPAGYRSTLSLYETQEAIDLIKSTFQGFLCSALNLKRVSAPLFVEGASGLNDDLNGVERPVSFTVKETGTQAQVVHSLAKWKRMALAEYGFPLGEGLYTDMNAIRRDEDLDNLHSVYVDQWDWEKVISRHRETGSWGYFHLIKSSVPHTAVTMRRMASFSVSRVRSFS